jgi:predicted nucleic acid-binding protein
MARAVEIARDHDATVYDATFVALAESLNVVMVTADARLAQRLRTLPCVRFLGDLGV